MQPEPLAAESVLCVICQAGIAEPEQEGDLLFFTCPECGSLFGYRQAEPSGPVCAAGLPVSIRADPAQLPGVATIDTGAEQRKVFLGVTIKWRAE